MFQRKNFWVVGIFWIALHLLLTLSPLLILLIQPAPSGRGFWIEFSAAFGYVGLAMMMLQFALTARFDAIAAPYGIDIVLQYHRYITQVAFALILAHPIILFFHDRQYLQALNFFAAPWRAKFAILSTIALILLVVTSVWRQKLKLNYEVWRTSHGIFAVTAVGLGLAHAFGVNYYLVLPWKALLWTLLAFVAFGSLIYVRLLKPWLMMQKPYRVETVVPQRGNAWTLVLRPQGHEGIRFSPGQFAWLTLDRSPYHIQEHPFSFSSNGDRTDQVALTIKAVGDFTNKIKHIQPGTKAFLDGPHGAFTPDQFSFTGLVLIANGVGVTPMFSILVTFAQRGDRRPIHLIYANASWENVAFREELEYLNKQLESLSVTHVIKKPPENWAGESGYINKELLARHIPSDREGWRYFLCGSPRFLAEVEKALHELEVPAKYIHIEHFNLV
ncbi:oxidoreductase FAD/NAD(P)-binding domain protein [Gloeocapsa sp. PCC 7428]|uniref:ferredoxin reductase family protein n=1 Tax=Gloeocapsa sp. PCC 7428 TaxID=1173026 RepID=UPI0002A5EC15|nr:ferric reductase-like transmembrane domain-containing protein [Gloeocapsa sp. PCC 7428]AFZ33261.1 oxidoreductase FAD/NAD(P)-binding domain protein [Gloeocapsa sp. PCC 7428]